jgi:hypothetical protein
MQSRRLGLLKGSGSISCDSIVPLNISYHIDVMNFGDENCGIGTITSQKYNDIFKYMTGSNPKITLSDGSIVDVVLEDIGEGISYKVTTSGKLDGF